MILNIPIIDKTQPDMLTWDCTQDGQYSVKSGYHAIMEWGNIPNASPSNNSQHIWNVLWKLKVPPKHSHLLWRVLHNALPVKNNLFKRGVSDGHWSTGLVLRRSDGSTVGVATRTHNGSADVVTGEAMGLMDAIEWIEKLGEQSVIFELDSQVIVKAVKGQSNIFKSWGKVVRRCSLFLKGNPRSDIKWVQRKANQATHEMTKWAEIEPNKEWTTNIPFCIWSVIQKDKGNIPSFQDE
ncbi:uncharacterized protein LOC123922626 [Trifolium pratense]|uniref:uncharacterized protein LOC123922626 n=1 Tax=Trifolium pratense TaxID=57577 RepID=UPI001E6931AF|nr:uncharacterized protein LOC123922626 [Trifolium pratense]